MKTPAIVVLLSWLAGSAHIHAAEGASALRALAVLPPDAARRVAGIIGCEGHPEPERWRFLVWDGQAENGFREWVVENGRVVTKNLVSQFASRVNPIDVIPPEAIQVDSDAAGSLAMLYAKANNVAVSTLRYSLRRTPEVTAPVWKVDCFDETEQQVGSISIAANEGKVLARLGFVNEPGQSELANTATSDDSKRKPSSTHRSARSKPTQRRVPPDFVAEQVPRATPVRPERRPFRLFRFGRD
jgi:hypothetical protein